MEVVANMAGSVWKVGELVEIGQEVVILESMKMETPVTTEQAGEVVEIFVAEGDRVLAIN